MAPVVTSIEIARPPDEVFAYATDPSRIPEWQEGAVSVHPQGGGPPGVGSRWVMTRRVGRTVRTATLEITEVSPPAKWAIQGIDGPVRVHAAITVEPLDAGAGPRVTIEDGFEGRGMGKLLVPLVVRQARNEIPGSCHTLKERLERST